MDPVDALTRHFGISDHATMRTLVSRAALARAVEDKRILRPRRGIYVLPHAHEAGVVAADARGVVSHLSAAMAWGWKVKKPPANPVITVSRHASKPGGKLEVHYANLPASDVVNRHTSRARTVADCARTLPFDEALSVADSALRSRKVTKPELLTNIRTGPRTGRTRALSVVVAANEKAANPFESVLRAIAMGVAGFEATPQGAVADVGHADVADIRLRIALEAESWENHGLREAFDYDTRRYTAMARRGWIVARFIWDEVMHKPSYVADVIADLVAIRNRA